MNWESLLYAPVGQLLWKRKQDAWRSRNKQTGDRRHDLLLRYADVGSSRVK